MKGRNGEYHMSGIFLTQALVLNEQGLDQKRDPSVEEDIEDPSFSQRDQGRYQDSHLEDERL